MLKHTATGALLASLLLAFTSSAQPLSTPPQVEAEIQLRLEMPHQVIDNFGASDAWSMQFLDEWPVDARNHLADLLFSTDRGIGLSCWRFNIGAGTMEQDIADPLRTVECFEVAPRQYDWTRQACAQWFLAAAKARGVEQFVAFVNSPPARLTRNGLTRSSEEVGSTNLKTGAESEFARFLVDVLEHFQAHPDPATRIDFDWISPVNEPQWDWNEATQEGNRASNEDILRIIRALDSELRARNLDTRILTPESGSLQAMRMSAPGGQRRYGKAYGKYLDSLCSDPDLADALGKVVASHGYWINASERSAVRIREAFRSELRRHPGWRYWQTEYCIMEGGRDLGMNTALDIARTIHLDLVQADASAWHWWTAVSPYDFKDGLIYTNYRKPGDSFDILPAKSLWVLGNYSRYIRPGFHRIEARLESEADKAKVSAFASPDKDQLVVVAINPLHEELPCSLATAPAIEIHKLEAYCTDDNRNLDPLPVLSSTKCVLPPRSVTTLLLGIDSMP